MVVKDITPQEQDDFNAVSSHPLQSYEWGEFRKKTGVKVIRKGFYRDATLVHTLQMTIHTIPRTSWTIGYIPKGSCPTKEIYEELLKIGKEERCVFIQLEPNIIQDIDTEEEKKFHLLEETYKTIRPSAHPLFTKYDFLLDLTKSEEELLKDMHPKARYNIKVAQKHDVVIEEDNSEEAFNEYLKLTEETTTRQKFYAHTKRYHELMFETLKPKENNLGLTAHLFLAKYTPPDFKQPVILTAWVLFVFRDTLYYPYGASSSQYRNVMASNLIMWEAIRFGKNIGLKKFDLWGALGPNPDTKDPWFGFHQFKERYGPQHVSFIGSYDIVIRPLLYQLYVVTDKLRWMYLKLKR